MAESLTSKILAELLSGSVTQDERCKNLTEIRMAGNKKNVGSPPSIENKEQKLRRVIDFGRGFYSIAQAAAITHRSKHSIRELIRGGKLTKLSFPTTSGEFVSGIELTELVIQHNLNSGMKVVQQQPSFVRRLK